MKKYIVITTINPITSGVKSLLDNDYNLVIVGDLKSPNEYQDSEDIFFLDINKQKELFPAGATGWGIKLLSEFTKKYQF